VLTLNAGLIVLVGFLPGGLMSLCAQSMGSVLKSLGS
jgi:NADH-quinone oxidoreductase subunit N